MRTVKAFVIEENAWEWVNSGHRVTSALTLESHVLKQEADFVSTFPTTICILLQKGMPPADFYTTQ